MSALLPKEHGVYGQLLFPTVTSLIVTGPALPAVLLLVAAAGGFLAHEPLLVLVGRRGPRARRDDGSRAAVWLTVTVVVVVVAGLLAIWTAPAHARWAFAVPLAPLAVVAGALATGREKTTPGEIAVALAFATLPVPMCLTAGAPPATGVTLAVVFGTLFIAGTLGVRAVVLTVRGGGDPAAVRATRRALLVFSVAVSAALVALAGLLLPWAALAAVAPGLVAAIAVAWRPPSPTRLRTLGWALVSTSTLAALVLIAALRT
jgi:hypothetical protein